MSPDVKAWLGRIDARWLPLVMLLVFALAAYEGWFLVLRKPQIEYQRLEAEATALAAALGSAPNTREESSRLQAEFDRLSKRMSGELSPPGPEAGTTARVMTELDRLAARDGIALTGVKPHGRREVYGFEELSYAVAAQGEYLALARWLLAAGEALGPGAAVEDIEMKSSGDGRTVALSLKLALFRPLQKKEAER